MLNTLIFIQYLGILILLIEIACTLYKPASFNQSMMLIFTASALVNTVGYLLELKATNQEMALYAVKFIYIGKPYIVLSMFLFVLHYCKISYPKILGVIMFIIHSIIGLSVLTCENQKWFYTSIDYTTDGVYPHLILGHGFLYNIYIAIILIYSFSMVILCIKRYIQSRDHSERIHVIFLTIITLIPLLSYSIYLSDITHGYDITAPSYILCGTLLLICSMRYNLLGVLHIAKDNVLDNFRDGILFIDNFSELIYSNKKAISLYPGLATIHHDEALNKIETLLSQNTKLMIDNDIYSFSQNDVFDQKRKVGSIIRIENITDNYNYTKRLQHDVKEKTKEINKIQHSFITSFTNLVEARDGLTGTHIKNTSHYVYLLCHELRKEGLYKDILTDEYIDIIVEAAPLHDIGKISIPDSILQKPGKLNTDEFEIIKTHSSIGEQIIKEIMSETGQNLKLETAAKMAKCHHERWDGTGYPCGLSGEDIPLCARIMSLADVYDALLSKRCYKSPMAKVQAMAIIKEGAGTQFDPTLDKIFLKVIAVGN